MNNPLQQSMTTPDMSVFRVGMPATEFIVHLVDLNKEIETLVLMSYRVTRGLEDRLPIPRRTDEDAIFQEALSVARERGVPLWIAVMNAYLASQTQSSELLAAAVVHDKSEEKEIELRRDRVTLKEIESLLTNLDPNFALGVSSRVRLHNGESRHIPMIDLMCGKSDANVQTLVRVFRQIGQQRGVLLDSGRSYHYYGLDLLDERDWLGFMGRSLLLTPLVDTRYLAHRLIDDYGRLRVSTSKNKPNMPVVVDSLRTS
ncbi:MAG: hypothetical protein QOE96_2276 [Blastocatellia bacterium]|jgi:hypothetical protein|nr:hypothetical protein [Blastocatellia bacterium]